MVPNILRRVGVVFVAWSALLFVLGTGMGLELNSGGLLATAQAAFAPSSAPVSPSEATSTDPADDVRVDVIINGERLEAGALVYDDRSFVRLEDVAEVLGGRYLYDDYLMVGFVLTGNYESLVADRLATLNPRIDGYQVIAPFVPGIGISFGLPVSHVTLSFVPSGLLSAFGLQLDDEMEHRPWFDLADEQSINPLQGDGHSQHLWVVDPALLTADDSVRVAFNGKRLNLPPDAMLLREGDLYVRLRELAELTGGGVGWDMAQRIASAKILPGEELTLNTLRSLNTRSISYYEPISAFVPSLGYRFGPDGPGLIFGLDGRERVAVVGALFRAEGTPWFPWFDQPHGEAPDFPGVGKAYSQHIYLIVEEDIQF